MPIESDEDVNIALKSYKEFEASIQNQDWMKDERTAVAVNGSFAVARYSTVYWYTEKNNEESFWKSFSFNFVNGAPSPFTSFSRTVPGYASDDIMGVYAS